MCRPTSEPWELDMTPGERPVCHGPRIWSGGILVAQTAGFADFDLENASAIVNARRYRDALEEIVRIRDEEADGTDSLRAANVARKALEADAGSDCSHLAARLAAVEQENARLREAMSRAKAATTTGELAWRVLRNALATPAASEGEVASE